MKKLILTALGVVAGAALVHAQGYLQLTSGTTFGITTNTGTFGNTTVPDAPYGSLISGKTAAYSATGAKFDYALLFIPTGVGTSGDLASLTDGHWDQLAVDLSGSPGSALFGTNSAGLAGNFSGQGGGSSVEAIGIDGQAFNYNNIMGVGDTYSYSIALVGWSANEGSSWSQVSAELSSGNWNGLGNFGYEVGTITPNSAAPGNSPTAIWGNNSLVLYTVPVPEPATLALAGLGGLSMLFLRRRKA